MSARTRSGQHLQGINHVLTLFRRLELEIELSKVLEEDNGRLGDRLVLDVVDSRVQHLQRVGGGVTTPTQAYPGGGRGRTVISSEASRRRVE